MKYLVFLILFLILNCNEKESSINISDITEIVYVSNNDIFNITNNYYLLDERYKEPGKHSLMMSKDEINLIKKAVVDEKIYKLDDSLRFVKSCKIACLSEIIIHYKSGRKQHFIFDNSNYKNNFNNRSYKKIIKIEDKIGEIYRSKKIDPETVNVYL